MLTAWRPDDARQQALRTRYLDHLTAYDDAMDRVCFPAHLTASTLVVDESGEHVLLTLHAKARRWFQFGGHCEDGDATLADAALREAQEESGIADLRLLPGPVQLDAHDVDFCHPGGTVAHLDVRYLAVAPAAARHATSAESLDVRWWRIDELPSIAPTLEPTLLELAALGRAALEHAL